jgi:O-antigen ligase
MNEERKSILGRIPRGTVFMLALLAFIAVGISYLNAVFTTSSRWLFLTFLIVTLIPYGELFLAFRSRFSPFLLSYLIWCFATGLWSEVPLLSMLKVAALAIVVTAFVGAGRAWATRLQPKNPLNFLVPVLAAAVFAGMFSRGHASKLGTGIVIYQGLAGNPNYLGILGACALPLPLYRSYLALTRKTGRVQTALWIGLTAMMIFVLWWSASRAAILCALVIVAVFGFVVTPGRRSMIALLAMSGAAFVTIAAPELEQGVYERVVVKSSVGGDVFFSRRTTWEKTYEGAKRGGVLGLGYGVSAGFNDFSLGLTSNTYGREKGNTQLAVWEETGLVGLTIYGLLLLTMFMDFFSVLARIADQDQRVEYALMIGLIGGLVAQSVFEAWWTSPGSMESAMFWAAVGVAAAVAGRHAASEPAFPIAFAGVPPNRVVAVQRASSE